MSAARSFFIDQVSRVQERLPMLVVYDHPTDHPDAFVLRLWLTLPQLEQNMAVKAQTLEALHAYIPPWMIRMEPMDGDDPKIVEVWL